MQRVWKVPRSSQPQRSLLLVPNTYFSLKALRNIELPRGKLKKEREAEKLTWEGGTWVEQRGRAAAAAGTPPQFESRDRQQ